MIELHEIDLSQVEYVPVIRGKMYRAYHPDLVCGMRLLVKLRYPDGKCNWLSGWCRFGHAKKAYLVMPGHAPVLLLTDAAPDTIKKESKKYWVEAYQLVEFEEPDKEEP